MEAEVMGFVIESAGPWDSTLGAVGQPVRRYRYGSMEHLAHELGLVARCAGDVVWVWADGSAYLYKSKDEMDRDETGACALAIARKVKE